MQNIHPTVLAETKENNHYGMTSRKYDVKKETKTKNLGW